MKTGILPAVMMAVLIAGCTAQNPTGTPQAGLTRIDYVREINNWQPDGTKGLYIQLDNKKWYYATFMAPCIDLPYAMAIGFRNQPPFPLDKFDSIVVQRRNCFFKSLDPSPGPGRPDLAVQPKPSPS